MNRNSDNELVYGVSRNASLSQMNRNSDNELVYGVSRNASLCVDRYITFLFYFVYYSDIIYSMFQSPFSGLNNVLHHCLRHAVLPVNPSEIDLLSICLGHCFEYDKSDCMKYVKNRIYCTHPSFFP